MHPQMLIISFILLSISLPSYFCQKFQQNANCSKPFECGRLRNIIYPFWGGTRSLSCGYPGFELNCDGDVPLLNISTLTYRVLQIDFSTYTLRVARDDLWNNTCPEVLRGTTLDPIYFEFSPESGDSRVNLYYNCAGNRGEKIKLLNMFNCDVNGVTTVNIFDASSRGLGSNITCSRNISVPVNQTAALALETPTASSMHVLQEALASGFSVAWSADNQNCESCQQSGGTCGYNQDSGKSVCEARRQAADLVAPDNTTAGGTVPVLVAPPTDSPAAGGTPVLVAPPTGPVSQNEPPAAADLRPPQRAPSSGPERGNNSPNPAPSAPGVSHGFWIILRVMLGIYGIVILTVFVVCYLKIRRRSRGPNQAPDIEKFLQLYGYLALKRYKHSEIKKITKSFIDKLGQGGYGSVYKGMLPEDGCLVAVKVLTEINSDGEEFVNEVASISRTSHVNIVTLLGFCYDGNKRALVYEFMPNRSLDKFISSRDQLPSAECHLDLDKLYKIAVGVAKGLEYLHTGCSTRIVHFDIKPQNILLDEDFCPKISDFGLAKLCKKKQSALSLLGTRGTIGYIAPEVFSRNYGRVSHKSDVYSYGMMVLEMVGADKIVEPAGSHSSENYFPDKIYELVTRDVSPNPEDIRVEEEEETARKMILVGFWCIQTTPSDRPLMSKVVEMLEGSLQSIQIPPKPVLFTPTLPQQEFSRSSSAYTVTENSIEVITNG